MKLNHLLVKATAIAAVSACVLLPVPQPLFAANPASSQPVKKPAAKRLEMPLKGSVSVYVPRTPEDVARYLRRMRVVIDRYEQVALSTMTGFGGELKTDPSTLASVRGQSVAVINEIRSIVPPAELKLEHNQLATTLGSIGNFMEDPGSASGGGARALIKIQPMLGRLHTTLDNYHRGCKSVIAYYKLTPDLDPFGGESEEAKHNVSQALMRMQGDLLNSRADQAQSPSAGAAAQLPGGSLERGSLGQILQMLGGGGGRGSGSIDPGSLGQVMQMLGGGGGSGSIDPGTLGQVMQMLGGGGGSGSGSIDPGSLGQVMQMLGGGGGGGSGSIDPASLGQVMQMLGGGGGGRGNTDWSKLGGLNRLGGLDLGSLGDLSGKELNSLNELRGLGDSGLGGAGFAGQGGSSLFDSQSQESLDQVFGR